MAARKVEIQLVASSDPASGATAISPLGSRFSLQYDPPLEIPQNAFNIQVRTVEAQIWNTTPNFSVGLGNDQFAVTGPDTLDVSTPFLVTIPAGLYDVPGYNSALAEQLALAGAKTSGGPLVTLIGNNYTQRVEMTANYAAVQVDFSIARNAADRLGFAPILYPASVAAGDKVVAPNIANFALIQSYQIRSSLANPGLRVGGRREDVLAPVPITAGPGFQIVYAPFNPVKLSEDWMRGARLDSLTFRLTDQTGAEVDTNNEYWSARVELSYWVTE